ncbi:hypothetical protein BofuT4_P055280.1 [Botrytis cinerea T4]|uniref:Uncharacterized protein n=1 Tax=Botryotinia fuckeliana (strain T4) TaxID=999810 RepID=G2XVV7_BOTF4|nr:hypothetical protein BofuT4_P055280.1 [Botrytis cinerea T4]
MCYYLGMRWESCPDGYRECRSAFNCTYGTMMHPCGVASNNFVYVQSLTECPCPNCRFRSYRTARTASSPGDLGGDSGGSGNSEAVSSESEDCGCGDGWGGDCDCRSGVFGGTGRRVSGSRGGTGRGGVERGGTRRGGVGRGGTRRGGTGRGGGRAGRSSSDPVRQNPETSDRHNDSNGGQNSGPHTSQTVQGPSRQVNGTQNRWSTRGLFSL